MNKASSRYEYLDEMGIQIWQEKVRSVHVAQEGAGTLVDAKNLTELHELSIGCLQCESSKSREQVVFGQGPAQASLFVVGGFPTQQDDIQGQPFTGTSGQLLANMLSVMDVKKSSTYFTMSAKCRSTSNQAVQKTELQTCRQYLIRQIELVDPAVVLVLGEKAAQSLLESKQDITELMLQPQTVAGILPPIIVGLGLCDLIRTPTAKKEMWRALQLVASVIG